MLVLAGTVQPALAAPGTALAVQAAAANGTPVIPPPKPKPKPFTCTPSKKTRHCTKTAVKCKRISGVGVCTVKRVACVRVGKYKRCVLTTSTCRTIKSKKTHKSRKTCRRTGRSVLTTRISASITSGAIARFTLDKVGPSATTLVSTTTAAAPPIVTAAAASGPTVAPGAAIGALVLVLACAGLTLTRRRPHRRR